MEYSSQSFSEKPAATGQRSLAAIVFTDVVGYSRHAQINEMRAISNFQRDFKVIEEVCQHFDGKVLKTLGDGALLQFSSAIQALQCAIEIQERFHTQSLSLQIQDVLDHRIGIHLGDVLITETDILGDGVNVANRLQSAAKPGSIYFSRTVYDVVKGKFQFNAVCVGPRSLKGIATPVVIWEIPAIKKQAQEVRNRALDAMYPGQEMGSDSSKTFKSVALGAALVLVLVALVFAAVKGIGASNISKQESTQAELHRGKRIHKFVENGLNANTNSKKPVNSSTPAANSSGTNSVSSSAGAGTANSTKTSIGDVSTIGITANNACLNDPAIIANLRPLFDKYDFAGMTSVIQQSKYASTSDGQAAIATYNALADLMNWESQKLNLTFKNNPVNVASWPPAGQNALIYRLSADSIRVTSSGVAATINLSDLTKDQTIALDQALLSLPGSTTGSSVTQIQAEIGALQEETSRFTGS